MVIEINKDIDRYKESVAMGLTAKQLVFSVASVVVGGGIVLLLYRYIGLTPSVYLAMPIVAPIAMGGFYSVNEMSFFDVMRRKIHMFFGNHPLIYSSVEGDHIIKGIISEEKMTALKEKKVTNKNILNKDNQKQGEFERMKRKAGKMLLGILAVIVIVVFSVILYKTNY